jgi:hypothetical protein
MSPVTRERHEWEGDKNKLGGKDWVEDDRCGCVISLQTGDADGDGDEIRRGVGAERSALIQAAALVLCWRVRSTHLAPAVHEGGSRGAAEQATRPRALFI